MTPIDPTQLDAAARRLAERDVEVWAALQRPWRCEQKPARRKPETKRVQARTKKVKFVEEAK